MLFYDLNLILLFFFSIIYLYSKHDVANDSTISEWLINYKGGFTRRGFLKLLAALGIGAAGDQGSSAAHSGWIRRKELTGNNAGRVQYEVLVALSKNGITSDADDDTQFSE